MIKILLLTLAVISPAFANKHPEIEIRPDKCCSKELVPIGSEVVIHYYVFLSNGTVIDSTYTVNKG